jgi:hypothetical protein
MAELKTTKNDGSVEDFLATIQDAEKREDARAVMRLMQKVTREKPKMWGNSIVGFGEFHYRYASGREGDWLLTGFSPRAQNLTLYLMAGFANLKDKLKNLGKHQTSSSCLHVKRLADVDLAVLESIVAQGVAETRALEAPKSVAPAAKAKGGPAARTKASRKASPQRSAAKSARSTPARANGKSRTQNTARAANAASRAARAKKR